MKSTKTCFSFRALAITHRIWLWLRTTWLWHMLKRVAFLRRTLYVVIQVRRVWNEEDECSQNSVDRFFQMKNDPWDYEISPMEQERFVTQSTLIDSISERRRFVHGLEIGCAEGLYTESLTERCERLLVLDISPTALARARRRRPWSDRVRFAEFDLRKDPIPGRFDLIVVAGVLEYFANPATFRRTRDKLAAALQPGGYLLVETTRTVSPIPDTSWWGRRMLLGKSINVFLAKHHSLAIVSSVETDSYVITIYRKREKS